MTPSIATPRLGMTLALAAVAMLFIAFTSAYIVRYGLDLNWQPLRMPPVLVANTAVLLASSASLEAARRRAGRGWLLITIGLGAAFLAGQWVAWSRLAAQGLYLSSTPHSSFFYLLTGVHGVHLVGGLAALVWAAATASRRVLEVSSLYWHFMDGLWLYLFVLLFVWRI
jgi:cytochrome c oxidase subunit 3